MPLVCDRGISMINIAICDDEKKDIVHLKSILQEVMDKYSMSYDIQEYESGESLMQAASLFHLIFLDIVMNEESGIEIGKHIHRKNRSTKIMVLVRKWGDRQLNQMSNSPLILTSRFV